MVLQKEGIIGFYLDDKPPRGVRMYAGSMRPTA